MVKKEFVTNINAPRNMVWHTLWNDSYYREWAGVFYEGCYAQSDWQQGSEILFLSPEKSGMYSIIETKEEPTHMAFKHIGEMKVGVKQPAPTWSGLKEIYLLSENGDTTNLKVSMDVPEEWVEYFEKTFPAALQKVKEIAESDSLRMITIEANVNAPIEKVWNYWTTPQHIVKWNNASDDWHTPKAENDLREGGKFSSTMAAKDGSMSFDFNGIYDEIKTHQLISYTIADGRKVTVTFDQHNEGIKVTERFEAEKFHSIEMQRAGWQAILNSFKSHAEEN